MKPQDYVNTLTNKLRYKTTIKNVQRLFQWIYKTIVDEAIKEFNSTPEQMEEIAKLAMMGI